MRAGAILTPMKSIAYTFNGLASSLLLNIGCTALAEKLDPVATIQKPQHADFALAAEICSTPCEF